MVRAGQRLQQQRLRKGLTLSEVSKQTRIKESFLIAIEKGEYGKLPSPSYAHGFVKNYAEYLGFSPQEILPIFKREYDEKVAYRVLPKGFTREARYPFMGFRFRKTVIGIIFVVLLFSGFLFFQYRGAFFAPALSISSPKEGIVSSQDVTVIGSTDPSASLYVNNALVAVKDDGTFSKTVTLFTGKNTITIVAVNKFGKEHIEKRTVNIKSTPTY
jgi:cytoskeletal protein RodZ